MSADGKLKREVLGHLGKMQTVHLATWDGERPRVRPVSMICDGERMWVSTGCSDAKVPQMREHPVFEVSMILEGEESLGSLRISGRVRFVRDISEKAAVAELMPFFSQFWETPEDPTYCLVELQPEEMELMRPTETVGRRFRV